MKHNNLIRSAPARLAGCFLLALAMGSTLRALEPDTTFPRATPESTGLSADGLEQLADKVRGYLEEGQIVGAELLVIKNRRTVLHETFGWRDRDEELEMTADTIFNIRSMTKPLTGTAVQMLIDEGKLRLDDKAAAYLPGFDNQKSAEITIEQLLTHRAGLPVTVLSRIDQYKDLVTMANAIGERGPQFPPGSKFWYSDPGTDVLGAIVETVSETSLDAFWQERLFEPLGMDDSFVPRNDQDPRWKRLASGYIGRPGEWNVFWSPQKPPLYPFAWGSQTIYSTPRDYARFLALWMDRGAVRTKTGEQRVLSEAAILRALTPASEATGMGSDQRMPTGFDGLEAFYGQMAVLWAEPDNATPAIIGHSGSDGTFAWAWPEEDLMVLYFTQSRGGISGLSLERWIDELLLHPVSAEKQLTSSELYQEIQGEYLADFGSLRNTTIEVTLSNDRPALNLGRGRIIELRDPDADGKWRFAITDQTAVSFERNGAGQISALRMHEGPWSFEAPRKGVPIEAEGDPAQYEKYLGSFRSEEMDAVITVLVQNGRLALDKSDLPSKLPAARFELLPPDEQGRRGYRTNTRLAAVFDQDEDGDINGLRVFQDGEERIVAKRVGDETSSLPSIDEVVSLRRPVSAGRLEALRGVRLKGTLTVKQSDTTGPLTITAMGTDRNLTVSELAGSNLVEIVNPSGAVTRYAGQEMVHEGAYLEQARSSHTLFPFLDWREIYDTVEVVGRRKVHQRETFMLRTTKGKTAPATHFIDAETGDVLRTKTVTLTVNGDVPTTTNYEDYRVVEGLRFAHRIVARTQLQGEVVIEIDTIETGLEFGDDHFRLEP